MISLFFFALSLFGILLVFALYPLTVWCVAKLRPSLPAAFMQRSIEPLVSLVVVVRNAESFVREKIDNALALDYPADRLQVVIDSDGSTDGTEAVIRTYGHENRLTFLSSEMHKGKTHGINSSIASCRGEIIVLSDADALLQKDAVKKLVAHFADPKIGGVCGQRVISKDQAELKDAQRQFIDFDSKIKLLESRIGSISSCDGKIYAIRRALFQPIAQAVTDDLYSCLSIVRQHYRFVFEPQARAFIRVPSRNRAHELGRRRRIVCRGLRGIYLMRALLNPFEYGFYSFSLFANKVVRRALPISLIVLFVSSIDLAFEYWIVRAILAGQLAFYLLALAYPVLARWSAGPLARIASTAHYFCIGNIGTLMGVLDFLRGKRIVQWDPVKGDVRP